MVKNCIVYGCSASTKENAGVSFYRIPAVISMTSKTYMSDPERHKVMIALSKKRQDIWVRVLKIEGNPSESRLSNGRVCSKHFHKGKPADILDVDNPDWAPCKDLGYQVGQGLKRISAVKSHERYQKIVSKKAKNSSGASKNEVGNRSENNFDEIGFDNPEIPELKKRFCEIGTQTDMSFNDIDHLTENLKSSQDTIVENLKSSQDTIVALNKKLANAQCLEESFQGDDEKTKFYSGLPNYGSLSTIHEAIKCNLALCHNTALTTFHQLILTLMRLRLDLKLKDLSYRFGVTEATAGRCFRRTIHVLYSMLFNLIHWPDRDTLRSTMPECFNAAFGKSVTCIIDCFEFFIQSPSKNLAAAEVWSTYKHHKTGKVLVVITGQGFISFISNAWGGRTSDKHIVENSGFLDLIQPGDAVLADRGFLIKDSLELLRAELHIPAFTKGKEQLHPLELEQTREIANVRIHVERVIGVLKQKYQILGGIVPINLLRPNPAGVSVFDKILSVCSALFNLCPSIVN